MRCRGGGSPGGGTQRLAAPLTRGLPSDHWKSPSMVRSFRPIHWYSLYWSGGQGVCWGGDTSRCPSTTCREGLKGCWGPNSGRFGVWG